MRAVFIDANEALGTVMDRLSRAEGIQVEISPTPNIQPDELPDLLKDAEVAIIDHTYLPTDIASRCNRLKHVVFLGTGARSYMNVEELADLGIEVHIIKGYGDTAVAECAITLMWAAAKGLARMDREMRGGNWLRTEGVQLAGKTLGLVGFGSIAAEVARIATGAGMRVLAWNRSPKSHEGVTFCDLDSLLANSDVISLHLLLCDDTKGFLSRERIMSMKSGSILVNTARGALVDEPALIEALGSGHLRHAAMDVFNIEPLPAEHPFCSLPTVTLSAHSAFRTAEATDNLIGSALAHCRRIASASPQRNAPVHHS